MLEIKKIMTEKNKSLIPSYYTEEEKKEIIRLSIELAEIILELEEEN